MKTVVTALLFILSFQARTQDLETIRQQLQQLSTLPDSTLAFKKLYDQCHDNLVAYLQNNTIDVSDKVQYLDILVSEKGSLRFYTIGISKQMNRGIAQHKKKRGTYVTANVYVYASFDRMYRLPSPKEELYLLLGFEDVNLMTIAYAKVLQIKNDLIWPTYPAFEGEAAMLMYFDMDDSDKNSPARMEYDPQTQAIRIWDIQSGNEVNTIAVSGETTIDTGGKEEITFRFDGEKFVLK